VQIDDDGEDQFGQRGTVTRKQKEAKEKKSKHLTGPIARELFVECLQVVLRKQLDWLIYSKGLPVELEALVRDLWDLRIRNLQGIRGAGEAYKNSHKGASGQTGSKTATEEKLFSSQTVVDSDSEASTVKTRKYNLEWAGENWLVPRARETLGLCYLGCILLREPVRVGDFYSWARDGSLPYLAAVSLYASLVTVGRC